MKKTTAAFLLAFYILKTSGDTQVLMDKSVCEKAAPQNGLNCGSGIKQKECEDIRGCCWDDSREVKCFTQGLSAPPAEQCKTAPQSRVDCGWYGIDKKQCASKGCCWRPIRDARSCFKPVEKKCSSPLGLQNGSIPDSVLTASSAESLGSAIRAGLHSGRWVPKNKEGAWLQVKFTNLTNITAIETHGYPSCNYSVYHSTDGTHFEPSQEFMDNFASRKNTFDQPIIGRFLRIYPLCNSSGDFSLSLELYGCPAEISKKFTSAKECVHFLGVKNNMLSSISSSAPGSMFRHWTVFGSCPITWGSAITDRRLRLNIRFDNVINITRIATRGGEYSDSGQRFYGWVNKYSLSYKLDGTYDRRYKTFTGNADYNTTVINYLKPPLRAESVIIHPSEYYRYVVMRIELFGCETDCGGSGTPCVKNKTIQVINVLNSHYPNTRLKAFFNTTAGVHQVKWMDSGVVPQWLQIHFKKVMNITGITTEWDASAVQGYSLSYKLDESSQDYQNFKIFTGSENTTNLTLPLIAISVRINPLDWNNNISMTIKVYAHPAVHFNGTNSTPQSDQSTLTPSIKSSNIEPPDVLITTSSSVGEARPGSKISVQPSESGQFLLSAVSQSTASVSSDVNSVAPTDNASSLSTVISSSSVLEIKGTVSSGPQGFVNKTLRPESGNQQLGHSTRGVIKPSSSGMNSLVRIESTYAVIPTHETAENKDPSGKTMHVTPNSSTSPLITARSDVTRNVFSERTTVRGITPTSSAYDGSQQMMTMYSDVTLSSSELKVTLTSVKRTYDANTIHETADVSPSSASKTHVSSSSSTSSVITVSSTESSAGHSVVTGASLINSLPTPTTRTTLQMGQLQNLTELPSVKPSSNMPSAMLRRVSSSSETTQPVVQSRAISSTSSGSDKVTPTPSGDMIAKFAEFMKTANPRNKSSLQSVLNVATKLREDAGPKQGSSTLTASREIEDFALRYAEIHLNNNETMTMIRNTLVLQIRKVLPDETNNVTFPEFSDSDSDGAFAKLPPGIFGNESVFLVALVYKNMEASFKNDSMPKRSLNHRINSDIIAISAKSKNKMKKDVTLVFNNLKFVEDKTKGSDIHCVHWRFNQGGQTGGKWSRSGCELSSRSATHTECSCDHMTHFAVLMPRDEEIPEVDKVALTIITHVGLSLSIVAEILTLLALFLYTDMSDPRSQVRANFTSAMLAGQVVFLAGIRAVSNYAACVMVALMLQYFLLAQFCWSFIEAVVLYLYVIRVFDIEIRFRWLYGFSWGFPGSMMLISLVAALTQDTASHPFIHEQYCWLHYQNGLQWSFNAIIFGLIMINLFVLGLVVRKVAYLEGAAESKASMTRKGAKVAALLCPLLGVTWMVGFLNFSGTLLITEYLFAILNSLQGFLIFFLHTVRSTEIREKVGRKFRNWLKQQSWYKETNKAKRDNKIGVSAEKDKRAPSVTSFHAWGANTTARHRVNSSVPPDSSAGKMDSNENSA